MSATGLDVFDRTLQTTNIWLGDIVKALGGSREDAWHALSAVLRALRDRLPLGLSAHLSAELPLLVRGLYFEQWRPAEEPKLRTQDDFLERVSQNMTGRRAIEPGEATRIVFTVIDSHIDEGQALKIKRSLPEDIRKLWPESRAALKNAS
jgi:uncharacterized protein (DUF2267 family)